MTEEDYLIVDGDGDVEEAQPFGYQSEPLDVTAHASGFITFRPFHPGDREVLQGLHEEWFPVRYKQEFYDELVHQRMFSSGERLFTCAAVYHANEVHEKDADEDAAVPSHSVNAESPEDDSIVACIVGSMLDASRMDKETIELLISNQYHYPRLFYIMTLGTVTEFRNARLATTLVQKCIRVVENDPNCGALYLHVITFNIAAIRFYERLGFYRVKEIENYYKIDGKLYNCYLYARYFHGNRGHWDVYYVVGKLLSSVWQSFTKPLSMLTYSSTSSARSR